MRASGGGCTEVADNPKIGYALAHLRIRTVVKVGVCSVEDCSRTDTEIALIRGRGYLADEYGVHIGRLYSERAEDYIELCRSHHMQYDLQGNSPRRRALEAARANIADVACGRCGQIVRENCLPTHAKHCGHPRPLCSIEGCDRASKSRGWCATHYERWRQHGDPLTVRWRNATGAGAL